MKRRGALVVGACMVALAVGGAPSGLAAAGSCSSPIGPAVCLGERPAPFITPDEARQVTTALWDAQERANTGKDTSLYAQVDTGPALLEKLYTVDDLKCGCGSFYWTKGRRTVRNATLYLPPQQHYPLYFMASVLAARAGTPAPATGTTSVFFVTRADPSTPWKVAMILYDQGYDKPAVAPPPPANDVNGYETAQLSVPLAEAEKWPSLLASYYTSLKSTGAPPAASTFLPGPYTTGTDLAQRLQGYTTSEGVTAHYRFAVVGPPWVFSLLGTTTCAPILEYVTQKPSKPNTVFAQVDGMSPNWGPDLATGYYSTIVTTFMRTVCITPNQANGLDVWGPEGGGIPIHTGGIPVTPRPGTTRIL